MTKTAILLAGAILLVGCQRETENIENTEAAATEAPAQAPVTQQRERVVRERDRAPAQAETARPPSLTDPAQQLPQLAGELTREGYGLEMLIDGSSPQAFLASMEMIASETSPEQFQQLSSALRYLETYMLGPRNLSEFYQRLDAMTGQEVIELARQQRQRR